MLAPYCNVSDLSQQISAVCIIHYTCNFQPMLKLLWYPGLALADNVPHTSTLISNGNRTELDNTKSYYQLIIKVTIYEKRRIPRYEKGKFALKVFTPFLLWLEPRMWLVDLDYNFECDWLIELPDNKLADNNLKSELVENRSFLNQSQSRKL